MISAQIKRNEGLMDFGMVIPIDVLVLVSVDKPLNEEVYLHASPDDRSDSLLRNFLCLVGNFLEPIIFSRSVLRVSTGFVWVFY